MEPAVIRKTASWPAFGENSTCQDEEAAATQVLPGSPKSVMIRGRRVKVPEAGPVQHWKKDDKLTR